MDATPTPLRPFYSAHTLQTAEGDYALVLVLRGLESAEDADEALHAIIGPFEDVPGPGELH
jgi:hypothetical protein